MWTYGCVGAWVRVWEGDFRSSTCYTAIFIIVKFRT